jgi:hypothetical protein
MSDRVSIIKNCICQHCGDITEKWWIRQICCLIGCCEKCKMDNVCQCMPFHYPHKCPRPNVFLREIGLECEFF